MALGLPKVWSCCKLGGKSRIGYRENLHMTPLLFPPDFPWNKNVQLLKSESVNHRFDDPWSYWMVSKKCIQASWNIPRIDVLPFFLAEDSVGKSSTCFFYVFFFLTRLSCWVFLLQRFSMWPMTLQDSRGNQWSDTSRNIIKRSFWNSGKIRGILREKLNKTPHFLHRESIIWYSSKYIWW